MHVDAYATTTGLSQAGTDTSLSPITTSPPSSAITRPLQNITVTSTQLVTSTQSVISIQTVTVSVPVLTTITATWAPTMPPNSNVLAPTAFPTPTTPTGTATNSAQPTYSLAPTPASCPQNGGSLTRPDGVVLHLILCNIDWDQGTAKYDEGQGVGKSYQPNLEGCSKSCAGDPLRLCRAFVYTNNGTGGTANCFLRKLENTTRIAKPGFWGGVVFQGVNGGVYTLG